MTSATFGTAVAYPSEAPDFTTVFSEIHVARYLVFCVVSVILSFFFWTLYCLSFDLLLLNLALNTNQSINQSINLRFTLSDYLFDIFNLFVLCTRTNREYNAHGD